MDNALSLIDGTVKVYFVKEGVETAAADGDFTVVPIMIIKMPLAMMQQLHSQSWHQRHSFRVTSSTVMIQSR